LKRARDTTKDTVKAYTMSSTSERLFRIVGEGIYDNASRDSRGKMQRIFLCGHVVDRSDRSFRSEPSTLDEAVPVDVREEVLLEVVVESVRFILRSEVRCESFFRYSSIFELSEPTIVDGRASVTESEFRIRFELT